MYDQIDSNPQYATAKAERAPTVTAELAELVRRLRETIDYGAEKLGNVLAPEYGEPKSNDVAPAPVTSPIKDVEINLAANIHRLRTLLDRVEA